MVSYNIDFLISALIIVSLIILHFMANKRPDDANSKTFVIIVFFAFADIVFEIISTYFISNVNIKYGVAAELSTTIFYIMQVLIPFALVCYTESLRETHLISLRKIFLWGIPTMVMICIILTNPFTEKLFYFAPMEGYVKGPWYPLTFIFALANIIAAIVIVFIGRKELGPKKLLTLWEVFLLGALAILIQFQSESLLTTGFGLSLCVLVLYLTFNNPFANVDSMTGLYDKSYFIRHCEELIKGKQRFHVVEIELYQLENVNKAAGNKYGDLLVKMTSEKLNSMCGRRAFRISGRRFVLIADNLREYEDYIEELEKMFSVRRDVKDTKMEFSAILSGIVDAERLGSAGKVMDYAEYLGSLAQRSGTTELIQDDEQTLDNYEYVKKVEEFLLKAVEEDLFEVYFQPVYSLKKKCYRTVEALSRLYHPELGFIPPDIFIRQAERHGLITKITNLQLRRVCEFLSNNRNLMDHIKNVKINLSPMDLLTSDCGQDKVDIIESYGLPCEWFQMEITETAATQYREELLRAIETFKRVGIELCLDDFGSGYANLNTVMHLPFDVIKLDRSLLFNIKEDKKAASFYESIVGAFKNMGYCLISEGVETKEELELLEQWDVDLIQGYYFSKPLPPEQLLEFINKYARSEV